MPIPMDFPSRWYWIADDGRVYSAREQNVVTEVDDGYITFLASGRAATPWPRDSAGSQTNVSLTDVISVYGLSLNPKAMLNSYAAAARYDREVSGIVVSGVKVATDDRSKQMILGARVAAEADSEFTTQWVGSDGTISALTAPQIIAISNAVLSHVNACFATYSTLIAAIASGSVTTAAQIDTAMSAISP